jgi:glycosyltransferase involved in cell wall biosynthesis
MPKLSLCMIAKDEADQIGRCLTSVKEAVDEMIVVDTGSTDATAAIAAQLGARVADFPWDDHFGAARNFSLELATGDWILVLDADEALEPAGRERLRRIIHNDEPVEGYFCKLLNYVSVSDWTEVNPGMVFRLFRNKPEYRFQGAIHEQIINVIAGGNPQAKLAVREDLQILHYGYLKDAAWLKAKRQKYLSLVERALASAPEDRLLRYEYGEELFHAGRYQEALTELARAGDGLDPQVHFMPKLLRMLILSYLALQQYDAALQLVHRSIGLLPLYADLYHLGGVIYREKQDFPQAVAYFKKALAQPEQPAFYASVDGVRGYRTFYELGQIADENADATTALEYYTQSVKHHPYFTPALERLIILLNPYRDPGRVQTYLESIADFTTPEASLKLGKVLYELAAYRAALKYLERGGSCPEAPPDLQILQADCLFQHDRFDPAFAKLATFQPDHPLYGIATFHKLIGAWLQQNQALVNQLSATLSQTNLSPDLQTIVALFPTTLNRLLAPSSQHTPATGATGSPRLSTEGLALFNQLLLRALNIQAPDLGAQWIQRLGPELLRRNAPHLARIYQLYGYPDLAQYYLNLGA